MMDITYGTPPIRLTEDEFHALDYTIMRMAFDIHNEMGNLWDEQEYRKELGSRCRDNGIEAFEEVPVTISFDGFSKTYYIDLLANGAVYELKTATCISEHHKAQALNYLFLSNTRHGKIINFRPDSLQWHFVSTNLCPEMRINYSLDMALFQPTDPIEHRVSEIMTNLLSDWGSHLSTHLYQEALCHFLGVSPEYVKQGFIHANPYVAIHISGLNRRRNNLKMNLQKYLTRSSYKKLLWINFNQSRVEFSTLNDSA